MNTKNKKEISIGFTRDSETWNGRIAMISFSVIIIIELLTQQPILELLKVN
nr:Ycf17 [Erythrotrichia carnea]